MFVELDLFLARQRREELAREVRAGRPGTGRQWTLRASYSGVVPTFDRAPPAGREGRLRGA